MTPFEINLQTDLDIEGQRFANKWLFIWHNINIPGHVVDVEDFRGGKFHVGGIVFGGQIRQSFWLAISRYLTSRIQEAFNRWDDTTKSYPLTARLSSLEATRRLLRQFAAKAIHNATDTDRRLRGRGFPENVDIYDSSHELAAVNAKINDLANSHRILLEGDMNFMMAFSDRLDRRLKELSEDALHENVAIIQRMNARGLLNSSMRVTEQLNAIQRQLRHAIDWALAEASELPGQDSITRDVVQPVLTEKLEKFAGGLFANINLTGFLGTICQEVTKQKKDVKVILAGELRDFSQGIWKPRFTDDRPTQMTTNNTVIIHGSHTGPVQQAGANSSQQASFVMAADAVEGALSELLAVLFTAGIDEKTKSEIDVEVGTIRMQLKRSQPNVSVIQAAVRGIQQLAIGVAGNLLTPYVVALLAAVGLS